MSNEQHKKDWIEAIGVLLVVLGLCVWGVYVIERYIFHMPVTDRQFMPYHLATVLPGMLLWQHRLIIITLKRWFRHEGK